MPKKSKKPTKSKEPSWRRFSLCGVCGKKNQPIAITDCDEEWEMPGHPDHLFRDVCTNCYPDYRSREHCSALVYDAMRANLTKRGMDSHSIDTAIHTAWRVFWIELDDKALIQMARKLKVKHDWLKNRRSK